jgi:hypothetical protein
MRDTVTVVVARSVSLGVLFVLTCVVQVRAQRYQKWTWQRTALQIVAALLAAGMVLVAFTVTP